MNRVRLFSFSSVAAIVLATSVSIGSANAAFIVNPLVGGAPVGVNYANFDNLPLGAAGGTSGGINVSFVPDGQTVIGASSGIYAPPFISNSNGVLFGDNSVSGADTKRYLSTGIGSAILTLPGKMLYFGLLWGSVDPYNSLEFFNGLTSVGTVSGTDVTAGANGDQGVNGTYYVNILSDMMFDRVVASSTSYAFEFGNVFYNPVAPPDGVPEPLSLGLLGIGLLAMGGLAKRRKAV